MGLRNLLEDFREESEDGISPRPDEIERIYLGRYALTRRIIKVLYVPEVDDELPDVAFYRLRVVREGLNGKPVYSDDSYSTNRPDFEMVWRLNNPDILRHASDTEKLARRAKAGLGLAVVGAAYAFTKGTRACKSHKHNQV